MTHAATGAPMAVVGLAAATGSCALVVFSRALDANPVALAALVFAELAIVTYLAWGLTNPVRTAGRATVLFVLAFALVDLSELSVYRYLLISDLLLLFACGFSLWQAPSRAVHVPVFHSVVFLFIAGGFLLASLRAVDPLAGGLSWLHIVFLGFVIVPVTATLVRRWPGLASLALPAVVFSSATLAVATVAAVAADSSALYGMRRAAALGNHALWTYLVAWVGALALVQNPSWTRRVFGGIALLVLGVAIVLLRARMLWVATLCVTMAFLAIRIRRRGLAFAVVVAFALVVVGAYRFELFPPPIQARIAGTLAPSGQLDLRYRVEVVWRLVDEFAKAPLLGLGLGQSLHYLPDYLIYSKVDAIHNNVLHALVEGGVLAAVGWVLQPVAVLVSWRRVRRASTTSAETRQLADWAMLSILGIYLGNQFSPAIYAHAYYMLVGLLLGLDLRALVAVRPRIPRWANRSAPAERLLASSSVSAG